MLVCQWTKDLQLDNGTICLGAEAVQSHAACDNEIVNVPERGRIDTVTQSLLVKVCSLLLCRSSDRGGGTELQLPKNVVDGSDRISLSVLGDILGRALKNLDGLLKMPYGCGEQNMALLAPNIYILEYLRNTEQLTPAIRDKATKFLTSGGLLHWTKTYSETSASLAVEISSYVLLASLSASPLSTTDLGYASRIVRWLVRQQKAYGGFSSTQDTVVALQALALYSTRVFSREGTNTVTVQSPSGGQHLFDVNQNNKLLYQERAMQDTEWKYSVEMKGSACTCASVLLSENTPHNPMVALHYNIPTPIDSTTLSIKVKPEVDCNSNSETQSHAKTSISLPSLFQPFNHTLDIIQELPVQNLKPAVVKIYDYYQPVNSDNERHWGIGNMFVFSTKLLFLVLVTCSAEKKGNFGKLTACITEDNSLMLKCRYPQCTGSPSFNCNFLTTEDGVLLGSSYNNFQTRNDSTFDITAKGMEERKNITINYRNPHNKQHIKTCSTMGLMLHQAPTLLWPVVFMSLWKILS
ncbi:hypothetical protein J4Q44_G00335250 [Coregonus suidteri]|uniref:Alpha-macroglobulin receptor-binding domain-containing protein n=1 Tax=Coregonus suidteri TaxID=861788 RepID=A0AAN8KR12_9TELE